MNCCPRTDLGRDSEVVSLGQASDQRPTIIARRLPAAAPELLTVWKSETLYATLSVSET